MSQGELFAADVQDTTLQRWRLAPPCAFGIPTDAGHPHAPGWFGPHHCFWCHVDVELACARFDAAVLAGKYDAQGYTPAERRAQRRRAKDPCTA